MKRQLIGLGVVALMFGGAVNANATLIVDTGTPAHPIGWGLWEGQRLAGEFSIAKSETITGVEAYLTYNVTVGQSLTGAIYTDGGDIPGTELYSQQFATNDSVNGWYGTDILNWVLSAGTYWVAFEVRVGDTYYGGLGSDAPTPLDNEAAFTYSEWHGSDDLALGIRVSALDPVPEPATMILFGTGLVGLVGSRLRKKKQQ